ncbi:MAG: hypothetical protein LBP76_08595, partial [Treponema sp.]|nr:hypothetical protein [Treponema sp.]
NEDGKEKRDCERNAAKRWIDRHKERYGPLKVTILGDDLYACHSTCVLVAEAGMHFLLNCTDESHPWIAEQVRYAEPETYERREWNHRNHLVYRYRSINEENVRVIAECGRARWKTENKHNNVLKHHGYNLKHNFGHGEEPCERGVLHAEFTGIPVPRDPGIGGRGLHRRGRAFWGRKDDFFWALRYETARYPHEAWHDLFLTVSGNVPDG